MNIIPIAESKNINISPACRSGAIYTSENANRYARELRTEFNELLLEAIRSTDIRIAARFTSLINELCVMTGATEENIKEGWL